MESSCVGPSSSRKLRSAGGVSWRAIGGWDSVVCDTCAAPRARRARPHTACPVPPGLPLAPGPAPGPGPAPAALPSLVERVRGAGGAPHDRAGGDGVGVHVAHHRARLEVLGSRREADAQQGGGPKVVVRGIGAGDVQRDCKAVCARFEGGRGRTWAGAERVAAARRTAGGLSAPCRGAHSTCNRRLRRPAGTVRSECCRWTSAAASAWTRPARAPRRQWRQPAAPRGRGAGWCAAWPVAVGGRQRRVRRGCCCSLMQRARASRSQETGARAEGVAVRSSAAPHGCGRRRARATALDWAAGLHRSPTPATLPPGIDKHPDGVLGPATTWVYDDGAIGPRAPTRVRAA